MILKDLLEIVSNTTGAVVNVHPRHPRLWDVDDLEILPRQTYHYGEYCQFRKLRGKQLACARNKDRSLELAASGTAFWGVCPFGVWDFAKPVFFDGSLIAVVYLGHFQDKTPLADVDGETYTGSALEPITSRKRKELSHFADFIADFMELACKRWVSTGNRWTNQNSPEFYIGVCENFIASHYTEPIRLQDLASALGLTANHLGSVIQKRFGMSFRALLENYRVEQAKVMIRAESRTRITEIAFKCGFSDSNYFSTVFKKITGSTPRNYRKINT